MKINSISSLSTGNLIRANNKNNKPSNNNVVNFKGETKIDPLCYQAICGIFPHQPLFISGKTDDGKDFYLKVEDEFAEKFLLNKKGFVIRNNFDKFIEIYSKVANELNETYHEEYRICVENTNTDYPDEFFDSINESLKRAAQQNITTVPIEAYEYVKKYFVLSQTLIGLDLGEYDLKMDLVDRVNFYAENFLYPDDSDIACQELLESGRDKYGRLDYDLIYDAFDLIAEQCNASSLKDTLDLLKKYYSYDENSKPQIKNIMQFLNYGYFNTFPEPDNFVKLMDLCFDEDKKFNPEKAEILRECYAFMSKQIDNALNEVEEKAKEENEIIFSSNRNDEEDYEDDEEDYDNDDDDEDYEDEYGEYYSRVMDYEFDENDPGFMYDGLINTGANVIVKYFDEITDVFGNLKPEKTPLPEFIQTML